MRQIEVTILGQSYLLSCPENGEAALREAVGRVDAEMGKIRDAGRVRARERMAVLAALNLAYSLAESPQGLAALGLLDAQGKPCSALTREDEAAVETLISRLDRTLRDDGCLI